MSLPTGVEFSESIGRLASLYSRSHQRPRRFDCLVFSALAFTVLAFGSPLALTLFSKFWSSSLTDRRISLICATLSAYGSSSPFSAVFSAVSVTDKPRQPARDSMLPKSSLAKAQTWCNGRTTALHHEREACCSRGRRQLTRTGQCLFDLGDLLQVRHFVRPTLFVDLQSLYCQSLYCQSPRTVCCGHTNEKDSLPSGLAHRKSIQSLRRDAIAVVGCVPT